MTSSGPSQPWRQQREETVAAARYSARPVKSTPVRRGSFACPEPSSSSGTAGDRWRYQLVYAKAFFGGRGEGVGSRRGMTILSRDGVGNVK